MAAPGVDVTPAPARIAVVGAGPSGLAACKVLREHGLQVTCYEAGDRVGGQWVLGNKSGTSAAYRSLRTNTNKAMTRFSDFSLPEDAPEFPGHEEMAAWFHDYARHFGLLGSIRFEARVTSARRLDDGRWQLETEGGDRDGFDALVLAIGNLWDPRWPELPGSFDGALFHAKDYLDPRDPVDCRGRSVLVLGLGNTACELAVELAEPGVAGRVLLSARSGQYIFPRRIGGQLLSPPHSADPVPRVLRWLPPRPRDGLFRLAAPLVLRKMIGKVRSPVEVGLPPPPASPFEKRAVVNDHILDRIEAGAIEVRPGVRALEGSKVCFSNGATDAVDVVIAATGYRFSTPFFDDGLLDPAGDDIRLYRGVMHPRYHDLFVVGVMRALCAIWPRSEQQARWVAALLSGAFTLPSQARIDREAYPVLRAPFSNCLFHTADLERDFRVSS